MLHGGSGTVGRPNAPCAVRPGLQTTACGAAEWRLCTPPPASAPHSSPTPSHDVPETGCSPCEAHADTPAMPATPCAALGPRNGPQPVRLAEPPPGPAEPIASRLSIAVLCSPHPACSAATGARSALNRGRGRPVWSLWSPTTYPGRSQTRSGASHPGCTLATAARCPASAATSLWLPGTCSAVMKCSPHASSRRRPLAAPDTSVP